MEESIGIGIVGTGYWGRKHARVFDELEDATVVALGDQRLDALHEVASRFPRAVLTTSLEHFLATPGVDAVVVCTPASTHFEVTRRCLDAGKHVLVEKPFTTHSWEGQELTRTATERGLTLMVGQTFLFNPGVRLLEETIRSGDLGRVHYMYARRTNLGPIRTDVNALWDLAPHDISIFNQFVGSVPLWVSAVGGRFLRSHLDDVGFVSLAYPDNVLAHLHVSWSDPNKVREVVVVGSHKRVLFDDIGTVEQVRIFEKGVEAVDAQDGSGEGYGEFKLRVRDGDIRSPRLPAEEPLKTESAHFLECVRTETPPICGGRAGTAVVQVMEAIDASLAKRGAPVPLDVPADAAGAVA